MEQVQFNLVNGASQKKRRKIIIALMTTNLISIVVGAFVLKISWIPLITTVAFLIAMMVFKRKQQSLKVIGTMRFDKNGVDLNNPEQGANRNISISSIDSVSLRSGVKADDDDARDYLTMYLNFHLKSGENLPVQLEVIEVDEYTTQLILDYFEPRNIAVNNN